MTSYWHYKIFTSFQLITLNTIQRMTTEKCFTPYFNTFFLPYNILCRWSNRNNFNPIQDEKIAKGGERGEGEGKISPLTSPNVRTSFQNFLNFLKLSKLVPYCCEVLSPYLVPAQYQASTKSLNLSKGFPSGQIFVKVLIKSW